MMKSILIFLALLGIEVTAATYSYEWKERDTNRPTKTLEDYFKQYPHTWIYPSPAMLCIYNRDARALLDLLKSDPQALSATTPLLDTKADTPTPDPRYLGRWACNGWNDLAMFGDLKTFKKCVIIDPTGWKTPDSRGNTPFMRAAGRPYQLEMVKYMVELGARVDQTNNKGSTALDFAIRGSEYFTKSCEEDDTDPNGIVKFLRSKGAKTGKELKAESAPQATPRTPGKPGTKK
jgi:hypothetical protein